MSDRPEGNRWGRVRRWLRALVVVSIWIVLLCTLPQTLGRMLWSRVGFETHLPLRHLVQVTLNSAAVLGFLLVTGRTSLLVPRRPARPLFLLFWAPILVLNTLRGPLVPWDAAFYLTTLAVVCLIGFWEEFLFRGAIQERLAVLGPRASLIVTALLFGSIHAYGGPIKFLITATIGLLLSLTRSRLGLWTLVGVHALIDLLNDVFRRGWRPFQTVAYVVIGAYLVVGLLWLWRER